jgi:hypothetical protein
VTIAIPSGQPNRRFMRYVRPPVQDDEKSPPLFPLRPATRPLRLGIDVTAVPAPPVGLLAGYLGREEVDVHLLISEGQDVPNAWTAALPGATVLRVRFTAVPEAWPMGMAMGVGLAADSETRHFRGNANFFPAYQLLDAQNAPAGAQPLTIEQRHHAAAYAAAAAKVRIDAIVTSAPTVGRSDVADNDVVASVTPDEAVALFGHYLRMASNPDVDVQCGPLFGGGGSWKVIDTAATIENFYDWGLMAWMPHFDMFPKFAGQDGGTATVTALKAIRVRLARAVRALDHLLAALSNPVDGRRRADVVEAAAEAFDRQLLYLAAAFDIYGRLYPLLIDPTRDPKSSKQSLDGKGYLKDLVEEEYDADALAEVQRLHVYATVCKALRNHVHDGVLPVDQHPGRSYGNSMNIALNLDAMPELLPGHARVDPRLAQEHYDALGVWHADPVDVLGSPVTVADLATAGVTLMAAGLALVEAFSRLLLRNRPRAAPAPSPLLGRLSALPADAGPLLSTHPRALRYRALLGWHSA